MAKKDTSDEPFPTNLGKAVSSKKLFGFDAPFEVQGFDAPNAYVPEKDDSYQFDQATTTAILAGFAHNRRVLIQGYHGTGKSTHIEQVAARLNWPCVRINLDSHVSRIDMIGRDAISLKDGKQITEFKEGILPWALRRPVALVFDEYDAGRPDVMFVIQRVLEAQGKLTLMDQNDVITPHPYFRIFATSNTLGMGDSTGLYHGTQPINQGQLDRWNIVTTLNYLPAKDEEAIIAAKVPEMKSAKQKKVIGQMVALAGLTRNAFINGDISIVMSPRTVLSWAQNTLIFGDIEHAFRVSFLDRCDPLEQPIIAECYQRCFNTELALAA